ncbi:hypothetical protein EDD18DRAFT_1073881, partial [Armillaria luteobubalina]
DFVHDLKNHLLMRTWPQVEDSPLDEHDFSPDDRQSIIIVGERMYQHKVLRINYTSYDVRREQDIINPRTGSDVVMLAPEDMRDAHPYWYARVVGIYHVLIHDKHDVNTAATPKQIDFLWVRWYGIDDSYQSGFGAKRLHHVGFLNAKEPGAFGFIDPNDVLRAVHLLPTFVCGTTDEFLEGPSIARRLDEDDEDYERYYVNLYVLFTLHM